MITTLDLHRVVESWATLRQTQFTSAQDSVLLEGEVMGEEGQGAVKMITISQMEETNAHFIVITSLKNKREVTTATRKFRTSQRIIVSNF